MQSNSKSIGFTRKELKILELLYDAKKLTYYEQKIYSDVHRFNFIMDALCRLGFVSKNNGISLDMRSMRIIYRLELPGIVLVDKLRKHQELMEQWTR